MANEHDPSRYQNQTKVPTGVNYQTILDRELEQRLAEVDLVYVASMNDLSPKANWEGLISNRGEYSLTPEENNHYDTAIKIGIVPILPGSQLGCMDGRPGDEVGPKTAGGTWGNAKRIYHALNATGVNTTIYEALERSFAADEKQGVKSGGHALNQCGAAIFAKLGITNYQANPGVVAQGSKNMLNSLGLDFSTQIQSDLETAAGSIDTDFDLVEITQLLEASNPNALPHLRGNHAERRIVIFPDLRHTLNNNLVVDHTIKTTGKEIQAFSYSWGFHLAIAEDLGGSAAEYYLQAVTGHDTTVLPKLTDGTPDIYLAKVQ